MVKISLTNNTLRVLYFNEIILLPMQFLIVPLPFVVGRTKEENCSATKQKKGHERLNIGNKCCTVYIVA